MRRTTGGWWCVAAFAGGVAALGLVDGHARGLGAAQRARSQWDGVFTEAQANRAGPLFDERCNVCHGGGMAPELFGDDFNRRWDGLSVGDLFDLISATMPQNDPGSLTAQEYVDILAYVLNGGGFPAGQAELPTDAATLRTITFLAKAAPSDGSARPPTPR